MEQSELIKAVLGAAPGSIDGRTAIQKLVYFASVKTKIDMGYGPHYYGPFSPIVAAQLENLTTFDFVVERRRWTVRDRAMYSYLLTDDGKALAKKIEKKYPEEYSIIRNVVEICNRVVHNNISVLSWAAKVHFILAQAGKSMTYNEAIETGRSFGWRLSEKEIESAAKLLIALRLIKENR